MLEQVRMLQTHESRAAAPGEGMEQMQQLQRPFGPLMVARPDLPSLAANEITKNALYKFEAGIHKAS